METKKYKRNNVNWKTIKPEIQKWIEDSNNTISNQEIANKLNVRIATWMNWNKKLEISYKGNQSKTGTTQLSKEEVFKVNSSTANSRVRAIIQRENLLHNQCAICGLTDIWQDKPLKLQLDHINGINNDNRLENLRYLCPNCHTQTETFCSKNKAHTSKRKVTDEQLIESLKRNQFIINRTFRELKLSGSGNYKRVYKLMAKYGLEEGTLFRHKEFKKDCYYIKNNIKK
jgi:transposase